MDSKDKKFWEKYCSVILMSGERKGEPCSNPTKYKGKQWGQKDVIHVCGVHKKCLNTIKEK